MVSDVGRTWESIERWLAEKSPQALKSQRSGASEDEIADMERYVRMSAPEDFRRSLLLHNPGGFIHGFNLLKIETIRSRWAEMNAVMATGKLDKWIAGDASGDFFTPRWWDRRWLPIAGSHAGTLVCLDMAPGPKGSVGQVLRLELEDDGPSLAGAQSFAHWLEQFLDALLRGEYRADENGDIEHV
jgi:cell wall assembly regulator SMI1